MSEPVTEWNPAPARLIRALVASDPDCASFARQHPDLSQSHLPEELETELLRDMVAVLDQFPERKLQLARLKSTGAPETFDGGLATIPLLLACAFLLRTHLRFSKHRDGRWDFTVEHKPADSALVKQLLANIARLMSRG